MKDRISINIHVIIQDEFLGPIDIQRLFDQ